MLCILQTIHDAMCLTKLVRFEKLGIYSELTSASLFRLRPRFTLCFRGATMKSSPFGQGRRIAAKYCFIHNIVTISIIGLLLRGRKSTGFEIRSLSIVALSGCRGIEPNERRHRFSPICQSTADSKPAEDSSYWETLYEQGG